MHIDRDVILIEPVLEVLGYAGKRVGLAGVVMDAKKRLVELDDELLAVDVVRHITNGEERVLQKSLKVFL